MVETELLSRFLRSGDAVAVVEELRDDLIIEQIENNVKKTTQTLLNQFFETLDTRIRSFRLDDLKIFVTDTVGFIEDLPTFLIDSFRSTLEESLAADIILIVVDGSEPAF